MTAYKYTFEVTMNGAAFDDRPGEELARLLLQERDRVRYSTKHGFSVDNFNQTRKHATGPRKLYDSNGNVCGQVVTRKVRT